VQAVLIVNVNALGAVTAGLIGGLLAPAQMVVVRALR
jgi:hypothetical protein